MPKPSDILDLTLAVQVALGSGYVAYLISYSGLRQHHSNADIFFRTLAFGLVATGIMTWTWFITPVQVVCAIAATITAGAFWRIWGMGWTSAVLRRGDVSWADDIPTAWLSVTATRTDRKLSQIAVEMSDGRVLLCADTRAFESAPSGPCVLGLSGDIVLYVTDEKRPNDEWFQPDRIRDPEYGANLTYVPASQIKRVELRYWTKKLNGLEVVVGPSERGEAARAEGT
jgi:hypothetical protein